MNYLLMGTDKKAMRVKDAMIEEYGFERVNAIWGIHGVKLEKHVPLHTDSQRGYYWRSLELFGDWLGMSRGETKRSLHNAVLCEAYGIEREMAIGGKIFQIPKERSAGQNRENYSLLIDTLVQIAADMGYQIPPAKVAV